MGYPVAYRRSANAPGTTRLSNGGTGPSKVAFAKPPAIRPGDFIKPYPTRPFPGSGNDNELPAWPRRPGPPRGTPPRPPWVRYPRGIEPRPLRAPIAPIWFNIGMGELVGALPIPWPHPTRTTWYDFAHGRLCGISPVSLTYDKGTVFGRVGTGSSCGLANQAFPVHSSFAAAWAASTTGVVNMSDTRWVLGDPAVPRYYVRGVWAKPDPVPWHLGEPFPALIRTVVPFLQPITPTEIHPSWRPHERPLRPGPLPLPIPYTAVPYTRPKPWNGANPPPPNPVVVTGPLPIRNPPTRPPRQPPKAPPRKPPGKGTKERKIRGPGAAVLGKLIGSAAELLDDIRFYIDLIDAAWDALPAHVRKLYGGKKASNVAKMEAVYKHFFEMDVEKFIEGVISAWFWEKAGGQVERLRGRIAERFGDWKSRYRTY